MLGLVPAPMVSSLGSDPPLVFTGAIDILIDGDAAFDAARYLAERLGVVSHREVSVLRRPIEDDKHGPCPGRTRVLLTHDPDLPADGYHLQVTSTGVVISGGDRGGILYGCVTLVQLLPPDVYRAALGECADWAIPMVDIVDAPRFGWRGALLDVARHYLPKRDVLRFIDQLAEHKMNVLHLHLTDDQGWRVEIRKYPRLTTHGSWRSESPVGADPATAPGDGRPHGGFYSRADLQEIVAYAGARNVTVVPEIDLPGHMQAAISAYPELGVTGEDVPVGTRWGISPHVLNLEPSTLQFVLDVMDEVAEIFSAGCISLGGDECPTGQWDSDGRTRERMRELGIQTTSEIQRWYLDTIAAHLAAHGRRVAAWDEILENDIDSSVIIHAWRGAEIARIAAHAGHDVVACPNTTMYLDYRESDRADEPVPFGHPITLADVYAFDPIPPDLPAQLHERILGGQANVWTENVADARAADYMAFPRLPAAADALWRSGAPDFTAFEQAMTVHRKRLEAQGIEYRPTDGPLPWQKRPDAAGVIQSLGETLAENARLTRTITERRMVPPTSASTVSARSDRE